MPEFQTYSCEKKSYSRCLGEWAVAFVFFSGFTKFFILDEFGDIPARYKALLSCIWILGWLAVLLLGFLQRYLYRLTIEFRPGGEIRIAERGFFKRGRTFDKSVTFRNIIAVGNGTFVRSSDEWEFGRLLSKEQRLGIVEKLNPCSSPSA
ncbi:MAG: hypothetical protein V4640_02375 [Verrucomicrobiota bacterium]